MSGRTVVENWTRVAIQQAAQLGLPEAELLAIAGLSATSSEPQNKRVSYERHLAVWERITQLANGRSVGIPMAENMIRPSNMGLIGFMLRNCETVGDTLSTLELYGPLLNENSRQRVVTEDELIIIEDGPIEGACWSRDYAENTLALYILTLAQWTGTAMTPLRAIFSHPRPRDVSDYHRVFNCALQFDAATLRLEYPISLLDVPILNAEPSLRGHLEERATRLLTELPASRLSDRVRKTIREDLTLHTSLANVARQLTIGARTLQRQLAAESTTFAELLGEVRREHAETLLSADGMSIDECAANCGFAHTSAFRRAFRRWTGKSPAEYRKAQLHRGGLTTSPQQ